MYTLEKEITKEQFERAAKNNNRLIDEDYDNVFSIGEQVGYGIYGHSVKEKDGKYIVSYYRGSSCD